MSYSWTDEVYALTHEGAIDLQNMSDNFDALKMTFAGGSSPYNTTPGMLWFDTANFILKVRNHADANWRGVMYGNIHSKVWMYQSAAPEGWVLHTTVTDVVLAVKGGSQAYNVAGGVTAGTWTQPSHVLTHLQIPAHDHGGSVGSENVHYHNMDKLTGTFPGTTNYGIVSHPETETDGVHNTSHGSLHTHTISSYGSGFSHNHGGTTYRPKAAVGILVYPNA